MKGTTMKYRAKRDFLGVTKGMEFPTGKINLHHSENIAITVKMKNLADCHHGETFLIDPTQYPDDFELVEEPKYTDRDLDSICDSFKKYRVITTGDIIKAIEELRQSKEKK